MSRSSTAAGSTSRTDDTITAASFEVFFHDWLVRQQHYLDELLSAEEEHSEDYLNDLVTRVLDHYRQYYYEKSRMARADVFLLFSAPWLTCFERTFLWMAGFKPALALRVVNKSINDLTVDQRQRMNSLLRETKKEEKMLNDEMARIHESVANPPFVEFVTTHRSRFLEDVSPEEAAVIGRLQSAMEALVVRADVLRINTVTKVVEMLNPAQNARFLAAGTQLQLRLRNFGLEKQNERRQF